MKGRIAIIMIVGTLISCCATGLAMPPLVPPVQYEQFCEAQKIAGNGIVDMSTSIIDKRIALDYFGAMAGDGKLELDQEQAYSQNADKLKRNISSVNGGDESNLNLYEKLALIYSGETPLSGGKRLKSKAIQGGMGAEIQEMFSVTEMEKDQTTFFASTTPFNPIRPLNSFEQCTPVTCSPPPSLDPLDQIFPLVPAVSGNSGISTTISPEKLVTELKNAGRDQERVSDLMGGNPAHLIGIETQNKFNGTWGTDATWHKIYYKDIKAHEMFTGTFEAEKLIKFHENPVPEKSNLRCVGIDC
jgi:hypothetical protein